LKNRILSAQTKKYKITEICTKERLSENDNIIISVDLTEINDYARLLINIYMYSSKYIKNRTIFKMKLQVLEFKHDNRRALR
jgi:hypothetical protein